MHYRKAHRFRFDVETLYIFFFQICDHVHVNRAYSKGKNALKKYSIFDSCIHYLLLLIFVKRIDSVPIQIFF